MQILLDFWFDLFLFLPGLVGLAATLFSVSGLLCLGIYHGTRYLLYRLVLGKPLPKPDPHAGAGDRWGQSFPL